MIPAGAHAPQLRTSKRNSAGWRNTCQTLLPASTSSTAIAASAATVKAIATLCPTVCGGGTGRLDRLSGVELPDEDGSTVDVQDFAGNEGREFGSKEEDRTGELLRPADPAQRNRRDNLLADTGLAQAGP